MNVKYWLLYLCITFTLFSRAQNLNAFVDNNGYFYIFDSGNSTQYEYVKPLSWQVGGNCVAWIDNNSTFKVYYNGEVYKPSERMISNYTVTRNQVEFNVGRRAFVFNKGVTQILTEKYYNFKVTDEFFVAQDMQTKALTVQYPEKEKILSTPGSEWPGYAPTIGNYYGYLYNYEAGRNIVAYLDNFDLKIYWNDSIWNIFTLPRNVQNSVLPAVSQFPFKVAKNIVAISNLYLGSLSIFYKGNMYELASKNVKNFSVGDDMVAYDDFYRTYVFYAGKTYNLYSGGWGGTTKDSVLVYTLPGYFSIFNKGVTTVVDDIAPEEYKMDGNTVAWIDPEDNLKAFYKGEIYTLTNLIRPVGFTVTGNTVWFKTLQEGNKVFWKGKVY